jgi:hypothetical protein
VKGLESKAGTTFLRKLRASQFSVLKKECHGYLEFRKAVFLDFFMAYSYTNIWAFCTNKETLH